MDPRPKYKAVKFYINSNLIIVGDSIDKLEAAINGNYMVINDLVRVLHNGAFCKQVVDSAIDRCKHSEQKFISFFIV